MSKVVIEVDDKDFCCDLLDRMASLVMGNEEWNAYHQFVRVMQKRFNKEGYRIYLDQNCKHKMEKIES